MDRPSLKTFGRRLFDRDEHHPRSSSGVSAPFWRRLAANWRTDLFKPSSTVTRDVHVLLMIETACDLRLARGMACRRKHSRNEMNDSNYRLQHPGGRVRRDTWPHTVILTLRAVQSDLPTRTGNTVFWLYNGQFKVTKKEHSHHLRDRYSN